MPRPLPTVNRSVDIKLQLIGTQIDDLNRLINQSIAAQFMFKLANFVGILRD